MPTTSKLRARSVLVLTSLIAAACGGAATHTPAPATPNGIPKVGPVHGSVIVVGGGGQGPEVFAKLIELAGGPDALILDVPAAGGDSVYPPDWRGQNGLKAAGAKNVFVLHTNKKWVANSDTFVAHIKAARGIWYEGGRQFHIIDAFGGTKAETALVELVTKRGGVASGSSAGASILGSFFIRGHNSNNNFIMYYPPYPRGFAYLRGVGIDQHVVARERLPDIADSLMNRFKDTLFISEDEGTAWVVQGDIAEIIGRNKAFVYNGKDKTDPGKPFITLHPGDKYDFASRHVIHRAVDESPVSQKFVDELFAAYTKPGAPQATVLVAQNGKVFIDAAYNVPPQKKYMPETTVPNFALGEVSDALNAALALDAITAAKLKREDHLPGDATVNEFLTYAKSVPNGNKQLIDLIAKNGGGAVTANANRRIMTPVGMHKTVVDTATGLWSSNVDELYRWELGLSAMRARPRGDVDPFVSGFGWRVDTYNGQARHSAFGTSAGKRNAFVRFPDARAAIIILSNSDAVDAKGLADKIAAKLIPAK